MNSENIGNNILQHIKERTFDDFQELLHPHVTSRLLIPSGLITTYDSATLIQKLKQWFEDTDHFELIYSKISNVGNRISVKYRFKVHDQDGWTEVEQQTFCEIANNKIKRFDLLCSGFQPLDS
jgi:hypothetical protein